MKGVGELPATPLMSLGEAGRGVWEERRHVGLRPAMMALAHVLMKHD